MRSTIQNFRHGAFLGLFMVSMGTTSFPVGIEEMLREPVKTETRVALKKENCSRTAPRVATATSKNKRTTVAKSEKGFKLFKWLL